ncbi:hypothetical protein RND71_026598 [Anisodus tanguticus]|uniref:Uncharacterized protein n=1 Tax=Anisodus tanguticus TaxID=243964 RepID=A0AAE1RL42_9SOLA|nr:hypothetical protein RND71_026598 [Anisodus tanguticus]
MRKKDRDEWVEPRAKKTYNEVQQQLEELCRTQQPANTLLIQEQIEQKWLDSVGGPTRFGRLMT